MPWFRLIRWKNLLIIFLTQLLAWWCVVLPAGPVVLTTLNFLLISLSTLLIAAAGYIINDYFDIKIDLINRPDKVVLAKVIPRKQAITAHTALNFVALIAAGIVAIRSRQPLCLLFQVNCTLLLWFYSTHFKRQYVTGNVVVALLSAFTVIVLIAYEPSMVNKITEAGITANSAYHRGINPVYVLIVYALFAFLLTWMREIVKDMEDLVGDVEEGCVTMPVKWGLTGAVKITRVLGVLVMAALFWCSAFLVRSGNLLLGYYLLLFVVLPLIGLMVYLGRELTPIHFKKVSSWLKIIMVSGIFSLVVYKYLV